jgi:hypothetical protein
MTILLPALLSAKDVVRPEEIKSKRQVVYDNPTYAKLADLWKDYYEAYPSEFAYANWMYAARYAGDEKYSDMLAEGVEKYPANPTLLYLKALEHHGMHHDTEGLRLMERAIALDPSYADPWFALVTHYMDMGDEEKLDLALRRLLESGIITDDVMDYNYNMLIGLEENAILITNGDNDTYPGWILTRILNERPDVAVVNRSLLNTDWYPLYVIKQGLPRFVTETKLEKMRESVLRDMKDKGAGNSPGGPFGDTLVEWIVESAKRAGRPVYLSKTLFTTPTTEKLISNGRDLGLVTLVTSSQAPYADQLRSLYAKWIRNFRTGGLDSWRLQHAPQTDAGKMLVPNYAAGIALNLPHLKEHALELVNDLFNWYLIHVESLLTEDMQYRSAAFWCSCEDDVEEVRKWLRQQGMDCAEIREHMER